MYKCIDSFSYNKAREPIVFNVPRQKKPLHLDFSRNLQVNVSWQSDIESSAKRAV